MELGKIQKAWVKSLREHPERQCKNRLGYKEGSSYRACCLGEGLLTVCRMNKKKLPFLITGEISDKINRDCLQFSYKKLGLLDDNGRCEGLKYNDQQSLAQLNDNGYTWTEIADFIEKYPNIVFNKSV